jgi:hypothetical protein
VEAEGGDAVFQDLEIAWPLAVPLDVVATTDLPSYYQQVAEEITIAGVDTVTGATPAEAHKLLTAALRARYARLTGQSRSA